MRIMDLLLILLRYLLRPFSLGMGRVQPALVRSPTSMAKVRQRHVPAYEGLPPGWLNLGPPFPGAASGRDRGELPGLTESPPPGGGGAELRS